MCIHILYQQYVPLSYQRVVLISGIIMASSSLPSFRPDNVLAVLSRARLIYGFAAAGAGGLPETFIVVHIGGQ